MQLVYIKAACRTLVKLTPCQRIIDMRQRDIEKKVRLINRFCDWIYRKSAIENCTVMFLQVFIQADKKLVKNWKWQVIVLFVLVGLRFPHIKLGFPQIQLCSAEDISWVAINCRKVNLQMHYQKYLQNGCSNFKFNGNCVYLTKMPLLKQTN